MTVILLDKDVQHIDHLEPEIEEFPPVTNMRIVRMENSKVYNSRSLKRINILFEIKEERA